MSRWMYSLLVTAVLLAPLALSGCGPREVRMPEPTADEEEMHRQRMEEHTRQMEQQRQEQQEQFRGGRGG